MNHFTVSQPIPGVYHIEDISKVCFTLVVGERDTLLWDTGLGLYDVAACIAPYVRGTLHVVLSHGHYDHVSGYQYFQELSIHPNDAALCQRSISKANRKRIMQRAKERGFLDDTFDTLRYLQDADCVIKPLEDYAMDLGHTTVEFIPTVGHTKGSMVAYIPERKLLLTGDMWNPYTWLFFPESQSLAVYTKTMKGLRDLQADHVLCSHDIALRTMDRFKLYIDGLNEDAFAKAEPCPITPYTHINTYCCHPEPDSVLVFNHDKLS